jgi:hypothetical protein
MRSRSEQAGYLVIDHRESPGLSPADVAHVPGAVAVGEGQQFERDVKQCSHCQRAVVLNPGRVRARAVCLKCDAFICDSCEDLRVATNECVPFKAVLDRAQTISEKFAGQPDHPDAAIVLTDLP